MAALTWYLNNEFVSNIHQSMGETSPGVEATTSPNYGWTVGTAAGPLYSSADAQTERLSSTFGATAQPDGSIVTTIGAGDCWRSQNVYTGTFDAGSWTFSAAVRAVTRGGTQDGLCGFRLFKSPNIDGSGATELSGGAILDGSAVTDLLTTVTQVSTHVSASISSFTVSGDYLFVQIGWKHTGAGTSITSDVIFRIGTGASLVTSTNFTPTGGQQGPLFPSTGATHDYLGGGDTAWTVPGNLVLPDTTYALFSTTVAVLSQSEGLQATNYGFTIPTGTITGIQVDIEHRATGAGMEDLSVYLLIGGVQAGTNKGVVGVGWATDNEIITYGGAGILWGLTPTTAQINASDFCAELIATNTVGAGEQGQVDNIRITIYYTAAAATGAPLMMMLGVGM